MAALIGGVAGLVLTELRALRAAVAPVSAPLFGMNVLISERGGTGGRQNSLYSRYNQPRLWQRVAALYYLSK